MGSTSRSKRRKPREIAPRLKSGDRRDAITHGLPPDIKAGLQEIARMENRSVSWVLERAYLHYFGLEKPEYVSRKRRNNGK